VRLALRIVRTIRPILGERRMLLYRHTPKGPDYAIAESLVLARELVAAGVDILDLSPSSETAPGDLAAPFRPLGVPVIAVNELDRVERAIEVLNEGRADLVAVGRGLIADPDWPAKVRQGNLDDIRLCVRCDEGCHGNLRRGVPVVCSELVE
jgi:2,4-dienoyl-CoA reductase-like NADH-dependent reductase (Old Yellow Enzyme family)